MQMNKFQSFQQMYTEIVCGTAWIFVDLQEDPSQERYLSNLQYFTKTQKSYWENSKISLYSTIFFTGFFLCFFALISNQKFPVFFSCKFPPPERRVWNCEFETTLEGAV